MGSIGFVNTECFQESANYWRKHKRYPDGDIGSYEYRQFWGEENKRVKRGYSVGGVRITGEHYLYLNYCPIELKKETYGDDNVHKVKAPNAKKAGSPRQDFPAFWDEDYRFFRCLEIARNGLYDQYGNIDMSLLDKEPMDLGLMLTEDNLAGGHHYLWLKPRGVGAPQPTSECVITPSGEKTIGSIQIGDYVYDRQGLPSKVIDKYPQGSKEVWEVEFLDGRIVRCGNNHLWTVAYHNRGHKDFTTEEMYNKGLYYSHNTGQKTYKYKLPKIEPVQFEEKQYDIHPYVVGALLGDGTTSGHNIKIASDDIEIVNRVQELVGSDYELKKDVSNNNWLIGVTNGGYRFREEYGGKGRINPLNRKLEELNLKRTCANKSIPEEYKYGSIQQRLELVKGLMDTDGSVSAKGYCEFTNKSYVLIQDLAYVLRSLGIYCSIGEDNRNGEKTIVDHTQRSSTFNNTGCFRLYIATNQNIFHLSRKANRISTTKFTKTEVPIVDIRPTGIYEEQICLSVENTEHLYLTTDFVPTHNSYKGGIRPLHNQFYGKKNNSTFILADSKEYLTKDGILTKYLNYAGWINKHADGLARNMSSKDKNAMVWRSSYFEKVNGRQVESGRLSEVIGITVDGEPDKARGKRGDMVWEEFGNFRRVADAWKDAMNAVEEDGNVWAQMVGYGTGNLKQENFSSLEKMFYDPKVYNLLQFKNVWDDLLIGTPCAAFTPAYRSINYTDRVGNSDEVAGRKYFDSLREINKAAKDPTELPKHCAQKPYCPAEAMASVITNIFPIADLKAHKTFLEQTQIHKMKRRTVDLVQDEETGYVVARPNEKIPYETFPYKEGDKQDRTGTVVIYSPPKKDDFGRVYTNMYRMCVDPYRHDTHTGESVGAVYVLENSNQITAYKGDIIAASYIGRPKTQEEFNENLFRLAEFYDCMIGIENDEPGDIIGYAKRHKKLHRLETQFQLAYDAKLQTKNSGRMYGMHIASGKDDLRKMQGDKMIQEWLLRRVGYNEEAKRDQLNLHRILDIGLIEELLRYIGEGNYDRISALRIGMFYEKELIYNNKKVVVKKKTNGLMERFLQGRFFENETPSRLFRTSEIDE